MIYLISDSDADGSGVRCVFSYYMQDEVKIHQMSKNDITGFIHSSDFCKLENEVIYFADLVPDRKTYLFLTAEQGNTVRIIDHHISNYRDLHDLVPVDRYIYHEDKCSALISYNHLTKDLGYRENQCLKEFVTLVDRYDRWLDEEPDFMDAYGLNVLLWHYVRKYRQPEGAGYTHFVNLQMKKFDLLPHFKFFEHELEVIKKDRKLRDRDFQKLLKKYETRKDSHGNVFAYFEIPSRISLMSSWLLRARPELDYVLAHNTFMKEEHKFSLRSKRDNIDLSIIAQTLGDRGGYKDEDGNSKSGGHSKASGCRIPDEEYFNKIRRGEEVP